MAGRHWGLLNIAWPRRGEGGTHVEPLRKEGKQANAYKTAEWNQHGTWMWEGWMDEGHFQLGFYFFLEVFLFHYVCVFFFFILPWRSLRGKIDIYIYMWLPDKVISVKSRIVISHVPHLRRLLPFSFILFTFTGIVDGVLSLSVLSFQPAFIFSAEF